MQKLRNDYKSIDKNSKTDELKRIRNTSLPIMAGNIIVGVNIMVDMLMVAQISSHSLGGVSLGSTIGLTWMLILRGTLQNVSALAGQAQGAGNRQRMFDIFRNGFILAIWGGMVISIVTLLTCYYLLPYMGQNLDVVTQAQKYMDYRSWGIVGSLLIMVFSAYVTVLGDSKIVSFVSILTVVGNIILNYMFIFGNWGAPKLDVMGAGIASALSQIGGAIIFVVYLSLTQKFKYEFRTLLKNIYRINMDIQRILIVHGLPLMVAGFAGNVVFAGIRFLAGIIGVAALATQQIIATIIAIVYMSGMAIGQAVSARTGYYAGAQNEKGVLSAVIQGHKVGFYIIIVFGSIIWGVGDNMPALILAKNDPMLAQATELYSSILPLMFGVVVADCMIGVWVGITRGLNLGKFFMYTELFANIIAITVSVYLGFFLEYGFYGLTMGYIIAPIISIAMNARRFIKLYEDDNVYYSVNTK